MLLAPSPPQSADCEESTSVLEVAQMLDLSPPQSGNCEGLTNALYPDLKPPYAPQGFDFLAGLPYELGAEQMHLLWRYVYHVQNRGMV